MKCGERRIFRIRIQADTGGQNIIGILIRTGSRVIGYR